MEPNSVQKIINTILACHPETQAIYLFGSWGTEFQRAESDLDVAVLFPASTAKSVDFWEWLKLSSRLANIVGVDKVDLINLRNVDAVLRKEVIAADRRIWCANESAALEFEALTLSLYHQLQYERNSLIEDAIRTGRFRHA